MHERSLPLAGLPGQLKPALPASNLQPPIKSSLKSLLETGQPLAETTKWPEDM
jgi:hypothetical protein